MNNRRLMARMIREGTILIRELEQLVIDQESFNANRLDCDPLDFEDDRIMLSLARKHLVELRRVEREGGPIRGDYTKAIMERILAMRESGKID